MFVIKRQGNADIMVFGPQGLLFANTFTCENNDDALYHIMNVWQQLGLDQLSDELAVGGDAEPASYISEVLKEYVRRTSSIDIPSEAYLLGGEILKAPLDVILFWACA
jgi:hypothetical protein